MLQQSLAPVATLDICFIILEIDTELKELDP